MQHVVVVGAGLAGLRSAEALRAAGHVGPLTVVGAEPHPPYNRPPLSKAALTAGVDVDELRFPQRAATADVSWCLGTAVAAADLGAHRLTLTDGATLDFDGLVVATGLRPRRLSLPGPVPGRHVLRTIDDARALAADLGPGRRLLVVGAGLVGMELASTAVDLGCPVTVSAPEPVPLLRALGAQVGGELARRHADRGVTFLLGRLPVRYLGTDRVTGVEFDDGSQVAADVVVEAVGSHPEVEWLAGNGLDLTNGVLTDGRLSVLGAEGVVAVGDVARFPYPRFGGGPHRVEHWSLPTLTARHAARSLLGIEQEVLDVVPTMWTEQVGVRLDGQGMPGLADSWELVQGDWSTEFHAVGRHGPDPVAVLGIGDVRGLIKRGRELGVPSAG
ncbi:MAG: NAD(P)H-nitrite reductase [Modestobacter sp.]|jgi:3-phenylpropionate/trans-cinnamate dioxygenase ferredoxin reductase subunit|nr:NAD(P)H-nitrite reductase [Modestobacter sp.]MCW2508033.1 NAD(P)H-nitrite reductase [Modestobacter sp.]